MKTIAFLPTTEFKVLKVIQIEGPEWNRFTGSLPYLRTFNPKVYDSEKGDIIDEKLLSAFKQNFPNSFLRYNIEVLFKGQLEDNLKVLEGGSRKQITIQFFPLIAYEKVSEFVGKKFSAYPLGFDIRLLFNEGSEKKHHIHDFFLCNIPYDIIDEKIKTIKPI